jgi:hypothetical protein
MNKIVDLTEEAFNKQYQIRDLTNSETRFDSPEIAEQCRQSDLFWNQDEVLKEYGGKYRKEKNK